MSVQMAVQDDKAEKIAKLAKALGIEKSESLNRLLAMGISRHNALARLASKPKDSEGHVAKAARYSPKGKKGKAKKAA